MQVLERLNHSRKIFLWWICTNYIWTNNTVDLRIFRFFVMVHNFLKFYSQFLFSGLDLLKIDEKSMTVFLWICYSASAYGIVYIVSYYCLVSKSTPTQCLLTNGISELEKWIKIHFYEKFVTFLTSSNNNACLFWRMWNLCFSKNAFFCLFLPRLSETTWNSLDVCLWRITLSSRNKVRTRFNWGTLR